jgi:hypothetical protein
MKILNDGLPRALYLAICQQQRPPLPDGEISVTELSMPPRAYVLMRREWERLEDKASNRLWATFGTAVHKVVADIRETPETSSWEVEQRLYAKEGQWIISGGRDVYYGDTETIEDYKVTKIFAAKMLREELAANGGIDKEWVQQLNLYALLCRRNDRPVRQLQLVLLIKNWSIREAAKTGIERDVLTVPVPPWEPEKAEAFLRTRLRGVEAALAELPRCTPQETWQGRRCGQWCLAAQVCEQAKEGPHGTA